VWKNAFHNVLLITMQVSSSLAAKRLSSTDFAVKSSGHLPYAVAIFGGTLLHLYAFRS
jgi:Flp pilus assembly protein protease CpaA